MEQLKKLGIEKIKKGYEKTFKDVANCSEEYLKDKMSFYKKSYIGDFEMKKEKFIKFLKKREDKEIKKLINFIEEVKKAPDFKNDFVINIQYTKNYTWGHTLKASTNEGFEGSVIGGCGYCKQSTATAQGLNSNLSILKLLFKKLNDFYKKQSKDFLNNIEFNDVNKKVFGYGSGYSILPRFDIKQNHKVLV
jgi:hypothetical protein